MCDFCLQIVPENAIIEEGVPFYYLNNDKSIRVLGDPIPLDQQQILHEIIKKQERSIKEINKK